RWDRGAGRGRRPPSARWNEDRRVPLSGGIRPREETLDPGSPPRELLFGPPVVRGHAAEQFRPTLLGIRSTEVVLFSNGSTVVPLVMPEVEIPPSVEVANAGTTSDFHFHTSKYRYAGRGESEFRWR